MIAESHFMKFLNQKVRTTKMPQFFWLLAFPGMRTPGTVLRDHLNHRNIPGAGKIARFVAIKIIFLRLPPVEHAQE
jgi:hypothetical protein